jgi:hypothetical protein
MSGRRALPLAVAAVLAACGEDSGAARTDAASGRFEASLRIRLDSDGSGPAAARTARLRCPSERRARACRRLRRIPPSVFRPVPPGTACTEQYGGPQRARIRGTVRGRAVDGRFDRTNGCEIARYERVRPLLRLAR